MLNSRAKQNETKLLTADACRSQVEDAYANTVAFNRAAAPSWDWKSEKLLVSTSQVSGMPGTFSPKSRYRSLWSMETVVIFHVL